MVGSPLKVLVVDDTIFYRKIVSDVLAELPGIQVVGTAANGKMAVYRIDRLRPDLLTLDIEMPEMNGLQVLEWIRDHAPGVGAIVLSAFTKQGSQMTVKALELGAFDYIQKTDTGGGMEANKAAVKEAIVPMLQAFARRREIRGVLKGKPATQSENGCKTKSCTNGVVRRMGNISGGLRRKSTIVAVGISTGGPEALAKMLPRLPEDLNVPVLVVQHMPQAFTQSITANLNDKCAVTVKAAVNGEVIQPGTVYFAPGGTQMKIAKTADGRVLIRLTDDHPENNCKPSADYLFRSIAHHYGDQATGVIMTGMGSDGALGLKLMKRNGALIIAQNEDTCTVYGMPKEPIESGIADIIAPLDRIADEIIRSIR